MARKKAEAEAAVGRFRSRIVGHGTERPDQLLANPKNFRIHTEDQQRTMEGVLDEVGYVQAVVVNRRTGFVVDGHLRVTLALRHDETEIPVTYVDLTDTEEALILATFDAIGALAVPDRAKAAELLASVTAASAAVRDLLATMGERSRVAESVGGNNMAALSPAIQLRPQREYLLVMCSDGEDGAKEWADLQARLGLGLVRRGGYQADSAFEAVSTQRVMKARDLLERVQNGDRRPVEE